MRCWAVCLFAASVSGPDAGIAVSLTPYSPGTCGPPLQNRSSILSAFRHNCLRKAPRAVLSC